MNHYETLLETAFTSGLDVKEKPLQASDGRIRGNRIAIRKDIETSNRKADILAEELGHHYTTVGDILDLSCAQNRKQERQARFWAYNKRIGLQGLIKAFESGCKCRHEVAEYLEVTELFLQEAIECYQDKYGTGISVDNYYIMFIPNLQILKLI